MQIPAGSSPLIVCPPSVFQVRRPVHAAGFLRRREDQEVAGRRVHQVGVYVLRRERDSGDGPVREGRVQAARHSGHGEEDQMRRRRGVAFRGAPPRGRFVGFSLVSNVRFCLVLSFWVGTSQVGWWTFAVRCHWSDEWTNKEEVLLGLKNVLIRRFPPEAVCSSRQNLMRRVKLNPSRKSELEEELLFPVRINKNNPPKRVSF